MNLCKFQFHCKQHELFEQFGKLRFVGIDKRTDDHSLLVGFIEFEEDRVADHLTSKGYMEIEDQKYQVKTYDDYIRGSKEVFAPVLQLSHAIELLFHPPDQDAPQNMYALNDDCLFKIFKYLHFSSLNALSMVCVRFKKIAKQVFQTKYQSQKISVLDIDWKRKPTLPHMTNFVREFGESIASLSLLKRSMDRYYFRRIKYTDTLLGLVNTHCKNLNTFEFDCAKVTEHTLNDIRPLFQQIKELRLLNVKTRSIFEIISDATNLEILELHFHNDFNEDIPIPQNAFPRLIEIIFPWPNDSSFYKTAMRRFIKYNAHVEILRVPNVFESVLGGLLKYGHVKKISELSVLEIFWPLRMGSTPLLNTTFSELNLQVKNLEMEIRADRISSADISLLQKIKNIKSLHIRSHIGLKMSKLHRLLNYLPDIQTLTFDLYRLNGNDDPIRANEIPIIQQILEHADQLSTLIFINNKREMPIQRYPIDEVRYYEILNSVEQRRSGIKLTIEFLFISKQTSEYSKQSQSIHILDMVPNLLTIYQRINGNFMMYSMLNRTIFH